MIYIIYLRTIQTGTTRSHVLPVTSSRSGDREVGGCNTLSCGREHHTTGNRPRGSNDHHTTPAPRVLLSGHIRAWQPLQLGHCISPVHSLVWAHCTLITDPDIYLTLVQYVMYSSSVSPNMLYFSSF